MKEKSKLKYEDWRDRLEAMRQNINIPLDVEPELIKKEPQNEHHPTQ